MVHIRLTTRAWENRLYRLPPNKAYHVYFALVPITTHTHDRRKSIGKKKQRQDKKIKERKEKKAKKEQGKKRKDKKRQEKKKQGKEKIKNVILADLEELTKDSIGLIEDIKCTINGTGEKTQQGEEVRAVLRYLVTAIERSTNFKTMMARLRL